MLQIKVTGWESQKYSGKHSHCGRSVELSPCIPQTEHCQSTHPTKDLGPQESELRPESQLDVAQIPQPEQLLTVSRLQEHSGWSGSVSPAPKALLQPHESHIYALLLLQPSRAHCGSSGRNLNKKQSPPEILSCKQDSSHPLPQGLNGKGLNTPHPPLPGGLFVS